MAISAIRVYNPRQQWTIRTPCGVFSWLAVNILNTVHVVNYPYVLKHTHINTLLQFKYKYISNVFYVKRFCIFKLPNKCDQWWNFLVCPCGEYFNISNSSADIFNNTHLQCLIITTVISIKKYRCFLSWSSYSYFRYHPIHICCKPGISRNSFVYPNIFIWCTYFCTISRIMGGMF